MWNSISKDTGILKICSYGEGIEAQLVLNGVFCGNVWIQHEDSLYYGPLVPQSLCMMKMHRI